MLDLIKKKKDEIINKKELSKSDLENLIIYGYLLLSIIENKLIMNENHILKNK